MASVKEVGERCARKYYGGDISSDAGLERIDFEKDVQSAYAYKVKTDYWITYRLTGERNINDAWLVQYKDVEVVYDEATDKYYSKLPQQVLGLPHSLGLYHVSPMQDFQHPFIPEGISESFLFTRNPKDYTIYAVDKNNVYYSNIDVEVEKVFMMIVPLIVIDVPEEFVTEIIELVLAPYLKSRAPEDKITDNNPNITQTVGG